MSQLLEEPTRVGAATHRVMNQAPPLVGHDAFAVDRALVEAVAREGAGWAGSKLSELGALLGSAEWLEHGRLANASPPQLKTFDRYGNRVNEVEYHPSYHALMGLSMSRGLHAQPWTDPRPGSWVARAAATYLMTQVEAGHGCPITMTFAAVPTLRHQPEIAAEWIPRITATEYDPRNLPAAQKRSCTIGMAMTEKQGGSDVRRNSTQASPIGRPGGGQPYRLVGHKWFCSAPMCDAFLSLAHTEQGLSCFLVPRWTPDGRRNAIDLQRLKDKLGNHANASSEIEYNGAWALLVGAEGHGVRTIIDMVSHTRLDCVIGSAAQMRGAVSQAIHHAEHREAFGRVLGAHPLMQNVLADLVVETEAAMVLAMRLARAYEEGQRDPAQRALARIATACAKYHVCKRTPLVVYEAMECHGGNGYVEESGLPRFYRDAPLNSIWEGSGNVICLDVLRALKREPASVAAFLTELEAARGIDARYDRFLGGLVERLKQPQRSVGARRLVEEMALALQGGLLLQHGPGALTEAFLVSRIGGDRGGNLGTLPPSCDLQGIIERGRLQLS